MKKRIKILFILAIFLLLAVCYLLYLNYGIKYNKPSFDNNTLKNVSISKYEDSMLTIDTNYQFYINGNPNYSDGYLYIDFYSNCDKDIYLKVRIYKDDKVIGESGLIRKNELLEKIKIKDKLEDNDNITYKIMSYTSDYYSNGEVKLNCNVSIK